MWNQLVLHWDSAMLMLSSTMLENVDLHPTGCSKYTACNGPISCQWIWFPVPCNSGQLVSCQLSSSAPSPWSLVRIQSLAGVLATVCQDSLPGEKNCLKSSTAGQSMKRIEKVWRSSSREVKVEGAFFLLSDLWGKYNFDCAGTHKDIKGAGSLNPKIFFRDEISLTMTVKSGHSMFSQSTIIVIVVVVVDDTMDRIVVFDGFFVVIIVCDCCCCCSCSCSSSSFSSSSSSSCSSSCCCCCCQLYHGHAELFSHAAPLCLRERMVQVTHFFDPSFTTPGQVVVVSIHFFQYKLGEKESMDTSWSGQTITPRSRKIECIGESLKPLPSLCCLASKNLKSWEPRNFSKEAMMAFWLSSFKS